MRKLTWLLPLTLTILLVLAATVSVNAQDGFAVDLSISPNSVNVGDDITITATVTNNDTSEKTEILELIINEETKDSQELTLDANESETVTFTVTAETPGNYMVELGDAVDVFTVKSSSFWSILPTWAWWAIGGILGLLLIVIIIMAAMPSRKKKAGAAMQGQQQGPMSAQASTPFPTQMPGPGPASAQMGYPNTMPAQGPGTFPMTEQFQTPGTFTAPGQFPAPGPMNAPYPQYARRPIFAMSNLTITPNQVKSGESVNISAIASNNGSEAGTYSVVLRINGMVENIIDLMLSPGASQATTFTIIKEAGGEYYTEVDGLSAIFIVIPLTPANFSLGNLVISPERAKQGENIIISAMVTNNGELPGTYTAALKLRGAVESTEEIELSPGESRKVAFKIAKTTPGFYNVELEGLTGRFVVEMEWQGDQQG